MSDDEKYQCESCDESFDYKHVIQSSLWTKHRTCNCCEPTLHNFMCLECSEGFLSRLIEGIQKRKDPRFSEYYDFSEYEDDKEKLAMYQLIQLVDKGLLKEEMKAPDDPIQFEEDDDDADEPGLRFNVNLTDTGGGSDE